MSLRAKARFYRQVALVLLGTFLLQLFYPSAALALTSGPSQPEFSSFEPISSTEMVDEFTGDFTYNLPVLNVPGPQGSGYSMSLSYHSGASSEEEASWVGYGWTLNPGAINRNTRGFPDDYKGQQVKYWNQVPNNWTVTVGGGAGIEAFSSDNIVNTSGSAALRYNNNSGFGYNAGLGLSFGNGMVSLGYNVSDGKGSFSLSVSPAQILNNYKSRNKLQEELVSKTETMQEAKENNREVQRSNKLTSPSVGSISLVGSQHGAFSYSGMVRPTQVTESSGLSTNITIGVETNPFFVPVGVTGNLNGSFAIQGNKPSDDLSAWGYLYASEAQGEAAMQDYYVEKESPYSKRDVFLGIPFNNADNFAVTGEGIGGGFRLYQKEVGQFYPNTKTSRTGIVNAGGEANVGWAFGAGLDLGVGLQTLQETSWKPGLSNFSPAKNELTNTADEPVFFRFNNDLGGSWGSAFPGDEAVKAELNGGGIPGFKTYSPDISHIPADINNSKRSGRSSFIAYRTNAQVMATATAGGKHVQSYSKVAHLDGLSDPGELVPMRSKVPDGLGELTTFNQNGERFIYGLPVYSQKEANLQFGVRNIGGRIQGDLFYGDVYQGDQKGKVGEERPPAYASTFLLTEKTTPDYLDKGLDGPTADDFGGYTKFNYQKVHGEGKSGWYKWRMPYSGLQYERNSLSDGRDDVATLADGEKEVYYLQSIETKTHAAIFILSDRLDSKEANPDAKGAALGQTATTRKGLKRLDQIQLYVLSDVVRNADGTLSPRNASIQPIKTVRLNYDYSLCKELPNSDLDPATGKKAGKLTLKSVQFLYQGIGKITPYEFTYQYPAASQYPLVYQDLLKAYAFDADKQNPDYDAFATDAWGGYQVNGQQRYNQMKPWLNHYPTSEQTSTVDPNFDPAVWQLKVIKLPSGGEIHVQYEQDEYAYVQDKPVHMMLNLQASLGENVFMLDVPLGMDKKQVKELIERTYLNGPQGPKKLYFKFLYNLLGVATPNLDKCTSEYISGYVTVKSVRLDGEQVFVEVGTGKLGEYELPKQVCVDFLKTQRAGKLNLSGNCDAASALNEEASAQQIVEQLLGMLGSIGLPDRACAVMNPQLSYLRIPVPIAKKGGGLRVKRLLTYDASLAGEKVLYGNEYRYQVLNGTTKRLISSGVATNEPSGIREENAMVESIARTKQSNFNKIIAGVDRKQSEGPLGESILPGASVGYSRVVVTNIHRGLTNPGFSVKQFHTAREFPMEVRQTELNEKGDYLPLPLGLVNTFVNNVWLTQGFSFILNNMHGQLQSEATYPGDVTSLDNPQEATATSMQTYEYYDIGEKVPMIDQVGRRIEPGNPGREVDITFAQQAVKDVMVDANLEQDVDAAVITLLPIPIIMVYIVFVPSLTATQSEMYTHMVSKTVRYPALVKKVSVTKDGIKHTSENVAFDQNTGSPVLVKSYDEFKRGATNSQAGGYLSQTVMASWEYTGMGAKSLYEGRRRVFEGAGLSVAYNQGYLSFTQPAPATPGQICSCLLDYSKGDLLEIKVGEAAYYYHVEQVDYAQNRIRVYPSLASSQLPEGSAIRMLYVLQSGKTNQLGVPTGSMTFHHEDQTQLLSLRQVKPVAIPAGKKDFVADLDSKVKTLATGTGSFELLGEYEKMDLSEFAAKLPESCRSQSASMKARNLKFKYHKLDGQLTLQLESLQVNCGSGTEWLDVKN